jgi:hypothetical protein
MYAQLVLRERFSSHEAAVRKEEFCGGSVVGDGSSELAKAITLTSSPIQLAM